MTDFLGLVIPGLTVISLALWWIHNMIRDYLTGLKTKTSFRSRCSYYSTIRGRRVPIETILKIVYIFSGIPFYIGKHGNISSVFTFTSDSGHFTNVTRLTHWSIFIAFMLHGVIDLMNYVKVSTVTIQLRYLTLSFAYFWFFFVFLFDTLDSTNKSPLELALYRMFLVVSLMTSLTVIWEMRERDNLIPQYIRCWCTLTIGTWFLQIAWALYTHSLKSSPNPKWDRYEPNNVAAVVAIFGLHLMLDCIVILLWYAVRANAPSLIVRWRGRNNSCAEMLGYGTEQKDDYEAVPLITDEEKETQEV